MYPNININILNVTINLKAYNLFLWVALLTGVLLAFISLRHKEFKIIEIVSIFFLLIICFFIGSRVLNYFVNRDAYLSGHVRLLDFRARGFSLYGGVLLSSIITLILFRFKNKDIWTFTDGLILPFGVSFFIMRIGCFMNGCCYGEYTNSFLGIPLPLKMISKLDGMEGNIFGLMTAGTLKVHPTHLYEGIFALIGVIILFIVRKRIKINGVLTLIYSIYFTIVRWAVLQFRQLPYPIVVKNIIYPFIYFGIIVLSSISLYIKINSSITIKNTDISSNNSGNKINI